MLDSFPYHAIPDGDAYGPHHFWLGVGIVLLVVWIVSDDRADREAWLVAVALLGAAFAFGPTWTYYAPVGAALVLLSLCVALVAVVARPYWTAYSWVGFRGAALLGLLVALDDALEHAFGWPMPLDLFWKHWLYGVVSSV